MRVAALYDIHANLPALQAVLEQVRRVGADQIVVGGDVLPGPMPRETLERLLDLDIPVHFIYGNGEVAVLRAMAGEELAGVPAVYQPSIRWTAEQVPALIELDADLLEPKHIMIREVGAAVQALFLVDEPLDFVKDGCVGGLLGHRSPLSVCPRADMIQKFCGWIGEPRVLCVWLSLSARICFSEI